MDIRVIFILIFEAALALFLLYELGALENKKQLAVAVVFVLAAFVLRGLALDYETLDYQNFLSRWVDYYRQRGGFSALSDSVGNYNIPYLYFMALFSYSSIRDLYLIKLLSILFDVLLAWGCAMLLGHYVQSAWRKLACFLTALFLPTVFLNGAVWGQCDGIFVALAVLALALGLEDHPIASMICLALSFGFKLQAVFVIPVFALLLFGGKLKWQHLFVFPLSYVVLVLPAVLLGRPFMDTILLYFSQTGSIGDGLNYNSSSIFSIFWNVQNKALASDLGIAGAFTYMMLLLGTSFIYRRALNKKMVLACAALLAIGIPFFLPHMHDRYFYAADILTLVLAFAYPKYALAAALTQFASLLGYHAYLKMRFLMPMRYGGWALVIAMLLLLLLFVTALEEGEKNYLTKRKNLL